jgi:hypothetical protein
MEDNRVNVLQRLAAADPALHAPEVDEADIDRVLAAILAEPRPHRRSGWRRKRLVVAAVAAIAVGLAAPALAFDEVRSFLGLGAETPAVLEESRLLVSAPVAEGTVARLWASPSKLGGECLFATYGPPGPVERAPDMSGGGACRDRPMSSDGPMSYERNPLTFSISTSKRPDAPNPARPWIPPAISGRVDPSLGATRVEVRWNGGSKALAFANSHFIGAVEELYEPPASALPFRLVAYDDVGKEVASRPLEPQRLS